MDCHYADCGARAVMLDRNGAPLCRKHWPRCDAQTANGYHRCGRRSRAHGYARDSLGVIVIELCGQHRRVADRVGAVINARRGGTTSWITGRGGWMGQLAAPKGEAA